MRFISTKVHALFDCVIGSLLIISYWLYDFHTPELNARLSIALGIIILIMTILSDYEIGIIKIMPMPLHLTIDIIIGGFLLFFTWVHKFNHSNEKLLLTFGTFLIILGLITYKASRARLAHS